VKLVRALIAAAATVAAAITFQLATTDAGATETTTDCGLCWPGGASVQP
jgi:hypothetical protein